MKLLLSATARIRSLALARSMEPPPSQSGVRHVLNRAHTTRKKTRSPASGVPCVTCRRLTVLAARPPLHFYLGERLIRQASQLGVVVSPRPPDPAVQVGAGRKGGSIFGFECAGVSNSTRFAGVSQPLQFMTCSYLLIQVVTVIIRLT